MGKDWLIKGGTIIDPSTGAQEVADLLVEGGRITGIAPSITKEGIHAIEAQGLWVVPGLIDIHVHFRDPGYEYKETIETGLAAAAAGGFTQVCCMANTLPVNDTGAITFYMVEKAKKVEGPLLHPVGAITKGQKGEGLAEIGDMVDQGAVAISDDGNPVMNSEVMRRAMEYASHFGIPVVDHCEDKNLSAGGSIHEGEVSARLGIKGIPAASEEVMVARDLCLARQTGTHIHIQHLSSRGSVELIKWAKELGIHVTCEVAPHHLALTHNAVESYDTSTKVNPPLRTEEDRQALIEALAQGIIDCVASDHAPHSLKEKDVEYDLAAFGISGVETALGIVLKLVHEGRLTPMRAIEAMSTSPARVMKLEGGSLKVGQPAHITIIDPEKTWLVEPEKMISKGKNTPFTGWELKGKAVVTMVEGKVVWREGD
ncbi:MAG: dihydroorotase [Aquificota bacterium]|nr:MAG: dihydroorotase [Aquificota bacterium]